VNRLKTASEFLDHLRSALRPRATFSKTLAEGALSDIHISLTQMTPEEYFNLPLSQRKLIASRLKDIIRVNAFNMRNPVASLLAELIRVASRCPDTDYAFIIKNGLNYGYEVRYGTLWVGNINIRNALNSVALSCPRATHQIIVKEALQFWPDIGELQAKEPWYHHDLREFLQNCLANDQCADELSTDLATKLDRLNEITHPATT
jgi:hypothetical protein